MKSFCIIPFLVALLSLPTFCGSAQESGKQLPHSLRDSLQSVLTALQGKVKDKRLHAVVAEALAAYPANETNLLHEKLLKADSLLILDWRQDEPLALIYSETLLAYLRELNPLKERTEYAQCLIATAKLHWFNDRYERALPLYLEALSVLKKTVGENDSLYDNTLFELSNLYRDKGDFVNHLPSYRQLVALRKQTVGEGSTLYAHGLHFLGLAHWDRGEYDSAMYYYSQSLTILKKNVGENHLEYVHTLNDMAHVYNQTGEYLKALPAWQQVLKVRKKETGEMNLPYVFALSGLAVLYYYLGDYGKALSSFEHALKILEKTVGKEHSAYPYNLDWLALVLLERKEYAKALACSREALALQKRTSGEEHYLYADGLNNLAVLYSRMGNYDSALLCLKQALTIRKKVLGEGHAVYVQTISRLAGLYGLAGKCDSALFYYRRALPVQKKILGEEHRDYIGSLFGLGTVTLQAGNVSEAGSLFMQASALTLKALSTTYAALSEQEKLSFLNKQNLPFAYLPSLLYSTAKNQPELLRQLYENELALKGMVLEDQKSVLSSFRRGTDSAALLLYRQWRAGKTLLGKQLLLLPQKRLLNLDSLREATDQLEQQLSRQSVPFRSQLNTGQITAKEISRMLSPGQAAIEFICFPYYDREWTDSILYAAMILLPGDSLARFVPLFEERTLRRLLSLPKNEEAAYAIQKIYRPESNRKPDLLYRLVWKPLEPFLSNVQTVFLAPAGLLHQVAFGALRDENLHCILNRYTLHTVVSTRSVASVRKVGTLPRTASLWGDIEYNTTTRNAALRNDTDSHSTSDFNFYTSDTKTLRGGEFVALPNTKKEIEMVTKNFRRKGIETHSFIGRSASEEAFKNLDAHSPQVLHMATHGFFLPVVQKSTKESNWSNAFTLQQNPMFRSGLVLAGGNATWKGQELQKQEDGILTAYEIAQLDLSNTELVVLSACETGLGDVRTNEGVIGLQRALKLAGVKQMLLSLWRVPDKETTELMTAFYRNWLNGQTTSQALRSAQLEMKKKYPPFYWAAFILIE